MIGAIAYIQAQLKGECKGGKAVVEKDGKNFTANVVGSIKEARKRNVRVLSVVLAGGNIVRSVLRLDI